MYEFNYRDIQIIHARGLTADESGWKRIKPVIEIIVLTGSVFGDVERFLLFLSCPSELLSAVLSLLFVPTLEAPPLTRLRLFVICAELCRLLVPVSCK